MLVLSRKLNETIVVGNDIRITVTRIARGQVRLAIDAPAEVKIFREEVCPRDSDRVDGGHAAERTGRHPSARVTQPSELAATTER